MPIRPKRRSGKHTQEEIDAVLKALVEQRRDDDYADALRRFYNQQQEVTDLPPFKEETHEAYYKWMKVDPNGIEPTTWEIAIRKKEVAHAVL